jgi:hypothetical protein
MLANRPACTNAPYSGARLCLQGALAASAPVGAYVSALNRPAFEPSRFWEVGSGAGSNCWVVGANPVRPEACTRGFVMARLLA